MTLYELMLKQDNEIDKRIIENYKKLEVVLTSFLLKNIFVHNEETKICSELTNNLRKDIENGLNRKDQTTPGMVVDNEVGVEEPGW